MRGCATGLLVLVLVAALLAGVAYVLLGQTPPGAAVAPPIPVTTPVTILVIGQIEARNGQLVAVVEQVDTGRAPLPDAFKEQIVSALSDLETLNKYLAIFVTDARVVDGHLALTGHPK